MIQIDCYSNNDGNEIGANEMDHRKEKSMDLVIRAAYQNYEDTKRMKLEKPPLPLAMNLKSRNKSTLTGQNTLNILRSSKRNSNSRLF